ncbi:hypothetical protein [Paenibacillus agilis]|uniref:Uncharacterized protein n=1 Tax=Paenibacillus agilis TaxID=3020863 RepID=A0A559IQ45_9BACL|nr:hypothetical protein [Paenibacillus agilis]TVX89736.1 hypothetical protein FPZ44_18455 [Paenibacillus agilis]
MNKKIMSITLLIAGGLLLFLYPFVMMANIMQLAAYPYVEKGFTLVLMNTFIFLTSIYPLTYIICLVVYLFKKKKSIVIPLIPLLQIVMAVIIFYPAVSLEAGS